MLYETANLQCACSITPMLSSSTAELHIRQSALVPSFAEAMASQFYLTKALLSRNGLEWALSTTTTNVFIAPEELFILEISYYANVLETVMSLFRLLYYTYLQNLGSKLSSSRNLNSCCFSC